VEAKRTMIIAAEAAERLVKVLFSLDIVGSVLYNATSSTNANMRACTVASYIYIYM